MTLGYTRLDTYTNNELEFSFSFPTTTLASNGCSQNNTVHGPYGNLLPAPTAYITTTGLVPLTVVSNGDRFWVAPATAYVLTGETNVAIDGNQYPRASGCKAVTTTAQLIEQYQDTTTVIPTYASIGGLRLTAKTVKQGTALNSELQTIFSNSSLQVSKMVPDSTGSWDNLSFTCNPRVNGLTGSVQPCAFTNGSYTLRYYPAKSLLIFWNTGQGCNLSQSDAASAPCDDSQVINSLKLL